jgi:hypothetical protein
LILFICSSISFLSFSPLSLSENLSSLAARVIFDATILATFPFSSFGAFWTYPCPNSTPYFGAFPSPLRCLNSAFSAPSSCTVLEGSFDILSSPPARASSLAARTGPAVAERLGTVFLARFSRYLARTFFSSKSLTITAAKS